MRELDNIDNMFAKLASMIDEKDAYKDPVGFAMVTGGLAVLRTVIIDIRRIADALEVTAKREH